MLCLYMSKSNCIKAVTYEYMYGFILRAKCMYVPNSTEKITNFYYSTIVNKDLITL